MSFDDFRIEGLVAAAFTAFRNDGSLDLAPIGAHSAMLARNGVRGVFVCGSTGEGDAHPDVLRTQITDENLMEFARCVEFDGGQYNLLWGRDEILLAGLTAGAQGAIGSTYNYTAPVCNRVIDAFGRGDMSAAMREMSRARESVQVLIDFGGLPAGKAMLRLCGIDCGPVRLPLRTLPAERVADMVSALSRINWDEIRCR